LVRVVVSSEAMTLAVSNLSVIALAAADIALPVRRKMLAMAPSEMVSPNNSAARRDRRTKSPCLMGIPILFEYPILKVKTFVLTCEICLRC